MIYVINILRLYLFSCHLFRIHPTSNYFRPSPLMQAAGMVMDSRHQMKIWQFHRQWEEDIVLRLKELPHKYTSIVSIDMRYIHGQSCCWSIST
jgi:hypothetical protein